MARVSRCVGVACRARQPHPARRRHLLDRACFEPQQRSEHERHPTSRAVGAAARIAIWPASPTRQTCLLRDVRSLRRPPPASAWPTTLHTLAPTSTRSHRYEAAATHTSIGFGAAAAERGSVQTAQSRWPSACARARKRAGAAPSLSSVWAVRSSPTALATRTLGSTTFAACSTAAARPRLSRARATPRLRHFWDEMLPRLSKVLWAT